MSQFCTVCVQNGWPPIWMLGNVGMLNVNWTWSNFCSLLVTQFLSHCHIICGYTLQLPSVVQALLTLSWYNRFSTGEIIQVCPHRSIPIDVNWRVRIPWYTLAYRDELRLFWSDSPWRLGVVWVGSTKVATICKYVDNLAIKIDIDLWLIYMSLYILCMNMIVFPNGPRMHL